MTMRTYLTILAVVAVTGLAIGTMNAPRPEEPVWLCNNQEHVKNAWIETDSGSTTSTTISCPTGWSRPYLSYP